MAALLAASCSSGDDNIQQTEQTPILLTSSVGLQTRTAVEDDFWYLQDEQITAGTSNVGVCIVRNDNDATVADNKAYDADGNGALTPADGFIPGFPTDAALVNIYAYAPYQSSLAYSNDDKYPFSVATDQTLESAYIASDLLLGTPPGNPISRRETAVNLNFKHALAKVIIEIKIGTDMAIDDFIGGKLTTCDMATSCNFSLKKKSVSADATSAKQSVAIASFSSEDILYYKQNERKMRAMFIAIPQEIAAGTALLTLTPGPDAADRTPLVYTLPADRPFSMTSGKCSELYLKAGSTPNLTLVSSTIKPWADEDNTPDTGTAEME